MLWITRYASSFDALPSNGYVANRLVILLDASRKRSSTRK